MKCCDIKYSDLRHKIKIYKLTKTATATGGFAESWVFFKFAQAMIKTSFGRESLFGDRLRATADTDFTIRYIDGIDETMKVVLNNTDYQIRAVNNLEHRNRYITLRCEKGVTQ